MLIRVKIVRSFYETFFFYFIVFSFLLFTLRFDSFASDLDVVLLRPYSGYIQTSYSSSKGYSIINNVASSSAYADRIYIIAANSSLESVSYTLSHSSTSVVRFFYSDSLFDGCTFPFLLGNPIAYTSKPVSGRSYSFDTSYSSGYYYLVFSKSDFDYEKVYSNSRAVVPESTPEPTLAPAPSDRQDSRLIFSSYGVDSGETIYPSDRFEVAPISVDMSESNDGTGGYTYFLQYHVEFPSRFFYKGHVGTALSNPLVTGEIYIESYWHDRAGVFCQFSNPVISLDSDVSNDLLNSMTGTSSGYASGDFGYALMDIPVQGDISVNSYNVCLDWSVVLTTFESPYSSPMHNIGDYLCYFEFNSVTYHGDSSFQHLTDATGSEILDEIHKEQVKEHEEEIEKANEASDAVTEGVTQVTDVLSSWEIFVMPVTLITEFVQAISGDGSSSFTFPSFNLMGYDLWPAYTFDLNVIADKFPLLYNSLHLISGILIVIAFIRYLWRKWAILTGDDMPEGEVK